MKNKNFLERLKDIGFAYLCFSPFICIGLAPFSPELAAISVIPICVVYTLAFIFSLFSGDAFSGSGDKYGGDDGGG